ncbi:MAG: packaged DNA stabilization protein [Pseudomonadota bacterium]
MPEIPIGGSFYRSESLPISAQECVNLYTNIAEVSTPSKKQLFMPAGIVEACTAGENSYNRGGINFIEKPYFVQGHDLHRIDATYDSFGVPTYSAVKVNGSEELPGYKMTILAENGTAGGQICIVVPELDVQFNAWIYTIAGGLVQISDSDFNGPVSSVQFVDGYFLFTKKDGQQFFISDLRDGFSYISTDFSDAEAVPDPIVACLILANLPLIFGSQTVQAFQNVGGTGFPFVAVQGSILKKGLASIYGAIAYNEYAIFLGGGENERPAILIGNSNGIDRLSTIAIENEIGKYSADTISNCFTWNYTQSGAQFVGFTFPGEQTFVFDFRAKEWHTRSSINGAGQVVPYRVSCVVDVYGVLMVGDSISNKIGILDKTVYTEYGGYVPRRFVTPQFDNEGWPFFMESIELFSQPGSGLTGGQGASPKVLLSISRDGGMTFEDPRTLTGGRIGEYNKRLIWNQCGRVALEACLKFEMTDPINWTIRKVNAEFE